MSSKCRNLFLLLWTTVLLARARILRLECKSYAAYRYVRQDYRLRGAIIATYHRPLGECEVECVSDPRCKSLNSNSEKNICELNSKTISDRTENCTVDDGNTTTTPRTVTTEPKKCRLRYKPGWIFKSTDFSYPLVGPNCNNTDPCSNWNFDKEYLCTDTCQCPGYECTHCSALKDYECPAPCESNPCKNGAECINNGKIKFTCNCKPGYTGPQCEQDINECNSDPCISGNTMQCSNEINSYRCVCNLGYTGTQCETALPPSCETIYCQNGGTCVDDTSGAKCICASGFTDIHCQTRTS